MVVNFRQAIADYIRIHAKPPDKFSHQPRVYRLAREIAQGQALISHPGCLADPVRRASDGLTAVPRLHNDKI